MYRKTYYFAQRDEDDRITGAFVALVKMVAHVQSQSLLMTARHCSVAQVIVTFYHQNKLQQDFKLHKPINHRTSNVLGQQTLYLTSRDDFYHYKCFFSIPFNKSLLNQVLNPKQSNVRKQNKKSHLHNT